MNFRPDSSGKDPAFPAFKRTHWNPPPDYTFGNFVAGNSNNSAHAAAFKTASEPGSVSGPLVIYGAPGNGKTHLMSAIGFRIMSRAPEKQVCCVTSEDYHLDVERASEGRSLEPFERAYRTSDVLLLDRIDSLAGKPRTQEALYRLLAALSEKQVALTAECHPKNLVGFDSKLMDLLANGLAVEIEPPELKLRIEILKNKAVLHHSYVLPDDVAAFIANEFTSVREREAALYKVLAYALNNSRMVSRELARELLQPRISKS